MGRTHARLPGHAKGGAVDTHLQSTRSKTSPLYLLHCPRNVVERLRSLLLPVRTVFAAQVLRILILASTNDNPSSCGLHYSPLVVLQFSYGIGTAGGCLIKVPRR